MESTSNFIFKYIGLVLIYNNCKKGRIYQIEYAMEAVKQGSATVGIKSKTHVVLVALKRAPSELSAHQKKIVSSVKLIKTKININIYKHRY